MLRTLCGLLMALALAPLGMAQILRVCVDDQPFPPLTFPDREGKAQSLIRQAAGHYGWAVEFISVPRRRCHAGVANGKYHALVPVAPSPGFGTSLVLPRRAGREDEGRSFGVLRAVLFRVRGTQAGWDGQRFSGLDTPVLYGSGSVALGDRLQQLDVPGDDSAKSLRQILVMLLMGRGQLGLGTEYQVKAALQEGGFDGRIEVLPVPFMQAPVYLGVGTDFYSAHQQTIEGIWNRIGELRLVEN